MSGWIERLFGGLFGGKKAPLSTSVALMNGQAAISNLPPPEPQKTAKSALAPAQAPVAAKAPVPVVEARETAADAAEDAPVKKAAKKRAPRKKKVVEVVTAPEAEVDEVLTEDRSAKEVAAQFAPQRSTERDVWFSDAVAWTLNGHWTSDQTWSPPPSSEGPRRLEEFREKAAEGKVVIWGRAGDVGVWQPIDAAYWRSCGVEQFSFLEGREKVFTEPKTSVKPKPGKNNAAKYTALMVSKRQVEEVWRSGMMH